MEIFISIALLSLALVATYVHLKYKRRHDLADVFPGPKPVPIFGNTLTLIRKSPDEVMQMVADNHVKYGRIYRVKLFNLMAFMVCDAKIIEIVLSNSTKYLAKNRLYYFLRPWLGDGLLLSTGKKWFNRRKIITPAFHFNILEQFVEIFDRQSQILVERLKTQCTGEVINIHPFVTLMALDVVCETAMGVKINAQTDVDNAYVKAVADIANIITLRFAKVWQRIDFLFWLFARNQKRKLDDAIKTLHTFTDTIIRKRREELIKTQNIEDDLQQPNEFGVRKKMALLDVLLKSTIDGEPLSNDDIREEVDTFMFEGHDTTTAGIIFALYLLSRHKFIQDKLFHEIVEVVGNDKNAAITHRHLSNMKYIENVAKESFRLYPPVPGIGRYIEEDILLENGNIIPAYSNFNLSLFVMFRDPEYFPDPEKFDPDRFNHHDTEKFNPYTFIPFSAGSRNCIGQKFAMLEVKSTISKILRHYELLPLGDAPITSIELVLRTKNGIQLGLKERKYIMVENQEQ